MPQLPLCRSIFVLILLLAGPMAGQVIGPNIDVIQEHDPNAAGCTPPNCDRLNKQVETDIAASPLFPARAVIVFNDYRLSLASGQSWCGWAQTRNAGHTWTNTVFQPDLFPGVSASAPQNFCTDPAVVWDVFGAAYTVLLAGVRGGETKVFVVKMKEPDSAAGGDLGIDRAVLVDHGQNFTGTGLDKPSIAYTPPSVQYPKGILHVVYAIFDGSADRTKIMYARSIDEGRTYSRPIKLNNTLRQNNNTTTVIGTDGAVYVFWTAFDPTQRGVVLVKSNDGGLNFTTPVWVSGAPASFFPYHQQGYSTADNFISDRSLVIPAAAVAGPPPGQPNGPDRVIVAWQEYAGSDGRATAPVLNAGKFTASPRIMVTASLDGGQSWLTTERRAAEAGPEDAYQIKPRLVVTGAVATLLFEDARGGGCEFKMSPLGLPLMTGITCKRNIRALQADLAAWSSGLPSWSGTSAVVTQFPMKNGTQVQRQRNCTGGCPAVYEPNHLNARDGTQPFTGDYIGLAAAAAAVRDSILSPWRLPLKATDPRTVYAVWADNRWGKVPAGYPNDWTAWLGYDGGCLNPGTRNIKPFFAQIGPGLVATWRGTDKQLLLNGVPQQPEIVMVVQNLTDVDRDVRLRIDASSAGDWSFSDKVDLNEFTTRIGRFSSVSRLLVRRGLPGDPTIGAAGVRAIAEEIGGLGLRAEINFQVSSLAVPINGLAHNLSVSELSPSDVQCLTKSSPQCAGANPDPKFDPKTQPSTFGFDTFGFDTFGFDTFGFDTFGFDTFGFDTGATPEADRDATWTVAGSGSNTTPVNALTLLGNGQELLSAGFAFQLLFYTTHWVPVDVDPAACTVRSLPIDVPLSNVRITAPNSKQIGSFGFDTFGFDTFGFDTSSVSEQISNASFPVANGEKVKLTLRAYRPQGTPNFDPLSTATGASQAAVGQVLAPNSTTEYVAAFDDRTPPVIIPTVTPAPNADGWNKTDVTVSWSVTDPGSGIGSASLTSSDPGVVIPPHSVTCPTVTISQETAGITLTCSATNRAGLAATPVSVVVRIDKTPPAVTITSPANGAAYLVGSAVTASYACADSLSGVATCTGPVASGGSVDTNTVGARTFTVNATDKAGNAGATTVTYFVTYQFTGFFSPLAAPGTFWGSFNLGKAVPIKYRLNGSGGVLVTALSSLASLKAVQVNTASSGACPVTPPAVPLRTITLYNPTRGATGGSTFRFDLTNKQFIFNWDTSKGDDVNPLPATGGCYLLLAQFDDGAPAKSGSLLLK